MTKTVFYAVNADGRGTLFSAPPVREEKFRIWVGNTCGILSSFLNYLKDEGFNLPRITFNDDPVTFKFTFADGE